MIPSHDESCNDQSNVLFLIMHAVYEQDEPRHTLFRKVQALLKTQRPAQKQTPSHLMCNAGYSKNISKYNPCNTKTISKAFTDSYVMQNSRHSLPADKQVTFNTVLTPSMLSFPSEGQSFVSYAYDTL